MEKKRKNRVNSHFDFVTESKRLSKRSQVTIFIILGILIIIVLILLFLRQDDLKSFFLGKSPIDRIRDCTQNSLEEGIVIVSRQGGSINPENYYSYEGNKLDYICFTEENFQRCVMQKPLLKSSIEGELESFIEEEVKECIMSVKGSLEKKGNSVSLKEPEISLELGVEDVVVDIELDMKITNGEESESYKSIKAGVGSSLYEFVIIASSIANLEAVYGDTDITYFMINNKWLKVEKLKRGDETRVYILTNRGSLEQFMFAVRSIPIPPGWVEV